MKKLIFTISFLCYFAVTSGLVINSHYCMKRLVSIQLFEKKTSFCGKCGMDAHEYEGCCRDEVKLVKLDQDQNKIIVHAPGISELTPQIVIISDFIASPFIQVVSKCHFHNHSPPLLSAQDTYLQNSVFRI